LQPPEYFKQILVARPFQTRQAPEIHMFGGRFPTRCAESQNYIAVE